MSEQQGIEKVLDLGCFDGFALLNVTEALNAHGTGVDLDEMVLGHASELAKDMGVKCDFYQGFIEDVNLGQIYDAVLLMEVLEHVIDPGAVVRAAARHLSSAGRIYVTLPASPVPHEGNEHEARDHLRRCQRWIWGIFSPDFAFASTF